MNYIKKMCILRQIKQGFSGDGKALSGIIKVEQYGKNLAVEVSIINFAPLVSGEYYCLLSDGKGKTEMLALRGKSMFNILSDIDIGEGFCAIICYVKTEIVPIAYGINGKGAYDWKSILNATLPPVFPQGKKEKAEGEIAETVEETPPNTETYDDEAMALKNYYEEDEHERVELTKIDENASIEGADKDEGTEERPCAKKDGDAKSVLNDTNEEYFFSVKKELDGLFASYPMDDTLRDAFSCSRWARIQGSEDSPKYLVGAVYEDGKIKFVCYAIAAEDKNNPPEEIKSVCSFVPVSPLLDAEGFFVIFQSATTGECLKPQRK